MECPRCDAPLTTYALEGARAVVCERCEYVGIPADLRSSAADVEESWDEAFDRFHGDKTGTS